MQHRGILAGLPPVTGDHQLGDHRIVRACLGRPHPLPGRELRQRYQFNRRTPYDNYSHSGDLQYDIDSGIGV